MVPLQDLIELVLLLLLLLVPTKNSSEEVSLVLKLISLFIVILSRFNSSLARGSLLIVFYCACKCSLFFVERLFEAFNLALSQPVT